MLVNMCLSSVWVQADSGKNDYLAQIRAAVAKTKADKVEKKAQQALSKVIESEQVLCPYMRTILNWFMLQSEPLPKKKQAKEKRVRLSDEKEDKIAELRRQLQLLEKKNKVC